ncbi:MAG: glycoside hydrolase family 95 protein, partial [Saprospiraceae bacterium]|nr:glycoside hydrolase family 95 protein [Saprospiraceae bacterium]
MKYTLSLLFTIVARAISAQSDHVLWFDRPAQFFEETTVLGNGRIGACVFGGVQSDSMFLNDATLWSGGPVNPYMNREAYKFLPQVREALAREDYRAADSLNTFLQGAYSQSYAPLGTLYLHFLHENGEIKNYRRELDIETALGSVKYQVNDVRYEREYFTSAPDSVMIIRLFCNKPGRLNFDLKLGSLLKHHVDLLPEGLKMTGYAPAHAEPSYRGNMPNAVV